MCTVAAAVVAGVAGTAVGAYSAIQQGKQQKRWAEQQAIQAEKDAKAEREAAIAHAEKIRKMARLKISEARAAFAKSGVDVNEGTPLYVYKDIYEGAEEDALVTIYEGKVRSDRMTTEAEAYRIKGKQAQRAGVLGAASTILGGSYQVASGWRSLRIQNR